MSKTSVTTKDIATALEQLDTDSTTPENDAVWKVIQLFFEENGASRHAIESFNSLIYTLIPMIVDKFKNTVIEEMGKRYALELGDVVITRPTFAESDGDAHAIYPMECVDRNVTYAGSIHIDTIITPPDGEPTVHQNVHWGNCPILVRSDACNLNGILNDREKLAKHREDIYDVGGYFVVKGARKVIVAQERSAYNLVYVFAHRKSVPKYEYYAEIRSAATDNSNTTKVSVGWLNGKITCLIPWIEISPIPLGVLFRALGTTSTTEVVELILGEKWKEDTEALRLLSASLESSYECVSREAAFHYIGKRGKRFTSEGEGEDGDDDDGLLEALREVDEYGDDADVSTRGKSGVNITADAIAYAHKLLLTEFLPHLGVTEESMVKKRYYLGYMTRHLLDVKLGRAGLTDRDHYNRKRVIEVGPLLVQQYYSAMRRQLSEIVTQTRKALRSGQAVNILSWIKASTITNSLVGAIANNNWSIKGAAAQGISQTFEQFNYAAGLANIRKMAVPMSKEGGKILLPRMLHSSHWSVVCCSESPEGKRAGLVKNMALSCCVTLGSDPAPIIELILNTMVVVNFDDNKFRTHFSRLTKIFVNGAWIASSEHPDEVVNTLRNMRRQGDLNVETSVFHHVKSREIIISTELGRVCRPLIIVDEGIPRLTNEHIEAIDRREISWMDLLTSGVVELVDKAEEEGCYIVGVLSDLEEMRSSSLDKLLKVTHCELHPATMFGIGGSIIPEPQRNQAPRLTYQAAMGKQAIGIPFANYQQSHFGTFHVMDYIQRPLALSRSASIIQFDKVPAGINAMTCVMPFRYNQEDSIEINKYAVDRGFMVSTKYICYYCEIRPHKGEEWCVPSADACHNFKGDVSKLDDDGIISKGVTVKEGDVLVGKRIANSDPSTTIHKKAYTNMSITYQHKVPGVIHSVQVGLTGEEYPYVRVVVMQRRRPEIGDKFCLTADHEVLTDEGWVPIPKVTSLHKVACLDVDGPSTRLYYENPSCVITFTLCRGDMLLATKGTGVDLCVTPEHKMWANVAKGGRSDKYSLIEAQRIINTPVYYQKHSMHQAPIKSTTKVGEYDLDINAMLMLMAMYIHNGRLTEDGEVDIDVATIRNKEMMIYVRKHIFGVECDTPENLGICNLDHHTAENRCKLKALYKFFEKHTDGDRRFFSSFLLKLDASQVLFFLDCFIDVDGSSPVVCRQHSIEEYVPSYRRGGFLYKTSDKYYANMIQQLAIHAGFAVDIEVTTKTIVPMVGGLPRKSEMYTVVQRHTEALCEGMIISYVKEEHQKVYCLTVPQHVFLVRRNGKIAWTGNSARHGQKGTCSMYWPQEDLPFNNRGISPDIMINSAAFPSRMTVAMLVEMLTGKKVANGSRLNEILIKELLANSKGKKMKRELKKYSPFKSSTDATPYTGVSLETIQEELVSLGINGCADEIMYDGMTGAPLSCLVFMAPAYYQRLKHMVIDKLHCLSPDHEVLTAEGWKWIEDVTMDDEVATLDQVSGTLVYAKPAKLHRYPYQGKMYQVNTTQVSLMTTPNHRMWVSLKCSNTWLPHEHVLAEDLYGSSVKYKKDATWNSSDFQFILPSVGSQNGEYEEYEPNMDAWLTFFGIWIAEGWASQGIDKRWNCPVYRVTICQCKQRVKDALYPALTQMGYNWVARDDKLHVYDKQLLYYLEPLSVGAPQKSLPSWVWKLSSNQCKKLIEAMILGDGSFAKNGCWMYYTASDKLADDFMRLCLHAGWSSNKTLHHHAGNITKIKGRTVTSKHTLWRLSVVKAKNTPQVNHGHHTKSPESWIDYEGDVYCLSVPNEVFYVRRWGIPVWTGNSRARGGRTTLMRGPTEGRGAGGGLRSGSIRFRA